MTRKRRRQRQSARWSCVSGRSTEVPQCSVAQHSESSRAFRPRSPPTPHFRSGASDSGSTPNTRSSFAQLANPSCLPPPCYFIFVTLHSPTSPSHRKPPRHAICILDKSDIATLSHTIYSPTTELIARNTVNRGQRVATTLHPKTPLSQPARHSCPRRVQQRRSCRISVIKKKKKNPKSASTAHALTLKIQARRDPLLTGLCVVG